MKAAAVKSKIVRGEIGVMLKWFESLCENKMVTERAQSGRFC